MDGELASVYKTSRMIEYFIGRFLIGHHYKIHHEENIHELYAVRVTIVATRLSKKRVCKEGCWTRPF